MSRWFVSLLLAAVASLAVSAQECSKSEYAQSTQNYVNTVAGTFKGIADRIRTGKFDFLVELNNNFTKAFKDMECESQWKPEYTEEDREKWLFQLMGKLDPKPPQSAIDLVENLEKIVWTVTKDHVFSTCINSVTRNHIITLLKECAGEQHFPVNVEELNDVTIPSFVDDEEFRDNVRGAINLMGWSLIRATRCKNDTAGIMASLNHVIKSVDEDFCYAGGDSFLSDPCYDKFRGSCVNITKCMDDLSVDLKEHTTNLFLKQSHRFKRCLTASTDHWGNEEEFPNGRPDGVPKAAAIMAEALGNWVKISKIKFTSEDKVASQTYLRALALSILRPHSCNCENPVPPALPE